MKNNQYSYSLVKGHIFGLMRYRDKEEMELKRGWNRKKETKKNGSIQIRPYMKRETEMKGGENENKKN